MLHLSDLGPVPATVMVSLGLAVVLLAVRVFVLQRLFSRRQRENRQQSERLKSMIAAYRALAGSFSPALDEHGALIEGAMADLVLFGSVAQVQMAADGVTRTKRGERVDWQPLIDDLRADLRQQLGLEPLPTDLVLPPSGPRRPLRPGRGEGGRGGGGGGQADLLDG